MPKRKLDLLDIQSEVPVSGLDLLPDEIVELIILRLPPPDVASVGACSSRLQRLASSDAVWRPLYETEFPHGRRSSGGLRWYDVYRRAILSVPKGHTLLLPVGVQRSDSSQSALAFDVDRRRVLLYGLVPRRIVSIDLDGALVASAPHSFCWSLVNLFVNQVSGTYTVVNTVVNRSLVPSFQVSVLDSDLNVSEQFLNFTLSNSSLVFAFFAVDSAGRLFALSCDVNSRWRVSTVDVALHQVSMVFESGYMCHETVHGEPRGMLIDSNDDFAIWYWAGRFVTYTAQGVPLSEFHCGCCPVDVRVSIDGVFAIRSKCGLELVGWTDEHLLVEDSNSPGSLLCLR
eukprot:TRINITY_DN719_c0_g1_i1.p1 TRINITY_DN719_c0_g1~~TRINITY_DN719_c0_g1_i1.p1  ORF type:complete len:343 (+),score=7.61 TRINITY_DN719_c0_g1_i1:85-1113(+)